jgi:ribosomal protein S18 acetylase RimI-like enzyme
MPLRPYWAFERGTLWAMDLTDDPPPLSAPAPAGVTLGEAQPEDVGELAAAMGAPDPQGVVQRFVSGRRCFVARIEGTIAAYGWVSEGAESIGELERTMRMQPGEAYIWDCVTLPAFRRRGLYAALLRHIVGALRGEGLRRLWIGASLDNMPSIRGFRSAGFRSVIKLVYLRVLRLRGNWLVGDATAPPALVADARHALSGAGAARRKPVAAQASHADASDIR